MWKWVENNWGKLLTVYVVIGLLTFGNAWNDSLNCGPAPSISENPVGWSQHRDCMYPMSGFRGIFWPILFIGETAIWLTK